MGDREAFPGVLFHQEKRNAFLVHFPDLLKDKVHNKRRQSERGLIKEGKSGLEDKDAA